MSLDLHSGSRGGKRNRRAAVRTARRALVTVTVLIVLFVGAGLLYTWYMGRYKPTVVNQQPATTKKAVLQPATMANDAQIGVSKQSFTTPVVPGSNASLSVKTNPKAACSIRVEYDKQASTDNGLVPKTADEYGIVSWAWTVEDGRPYGKWPVVVTCANEKNSIVLKAELELVSSKN